MNFIFTNPSSVKSNIMFDVDIYKNRIAPGMDLLMKEFQQCQK